MIVYLGGPIDLADGKDYRRRLTEVLHKNGINAFDPKDAFKLVDVSRHKDMKRLVEINKQAMLASTLPIFIIDKNTPSIGTPIELHMAHEAGKRCVVICLGLGLNPLPAYVRGLVNSDRDVILGDELDDDVIERTLRRILELKNHGALH